MGSGQASKVSLKKAGVQAYCKFDVCWFAPEVASSPTQQPFKSEVPTQFRTPYDGRAGQSVIATKCTNVLIALGFRLPNLSRPEAWYPSLMRSMLVLIHFDGTKRI
eukprot:1384762-Amorphochlora_amoeboformis.AAC.2